VFAVIKGKGSHQSKTTVFNSIHEKIIIVLQVSTCDGPSSGPHSNIDPDILKFNPLAQEMDI
jgi:hypothetical protein